MPRRSHMGLALPLREDSVGGFATVEGEDFVRQVLMIACQPCESLNPFQQELGVPEEMIFGIPAAGLLAKMKIRLQKLFDQQLRPQGLAHLQSADVVRSKTEGLYELRILYVDLTTRRPGQVDVPIRSLR